MNEPLAAERQKIADFEAAFQALPEEARAMDHDAFVTAALHLTQGRTQHAVAVLDQCTGPFRDTAPVQALLHPTP